MKERKERNKKIDLEIEEKLKKFEEEYLKEKEREEEERIEKLRQNNIKKIEEINLRKNIFRIDFFSDIEDNTSYNSDCDEHTQLFTDHKYEEFTMSYEYFTESEIQLSQDYKISQNNTTVVSENFVNFKSDNINKTSYLLDNCYFDLDILKTKKLTGKYSKISELPEIITSQKGIILEELEHNQAVKEYVTAKVKIINDFFNYRYTYYNPFIKVKKEYDWTKDEECDKAMFELAQFGVTTNCCYALQAGFVIQDKEKIIKHVNNL